MTFTNTPPTTAVYDNIDRLEETRSGCGTTPRVNGVLVQQTFIVPPVAKYYITANDRANYVRQLRSIVSKENYKFTYRDMTTGRITRDEREKRLS